MKTDFLALADFTPDQLMAMVRLADQIKAQPENYRKVLDGKTLGMIFRKN